MGGRSSVFQLLVPRRRQLVSLMLTHGPRSVRPVSTHECQFAPLFGLPCRASAAVLLLSGSEVDDGVSSQSCLVLWDMGASDPCGVFQVLAGSSARERRSKILGVRRDLRGSMDI